MLLLPALRVTSPTVWYYAALLSVWRVEHDDKLSKMRVGLLGCVFTDETNTQGEVAAKTFCIHAITVYYETRRLVESPPSRGLHNSRGFNSEILQKQWVMIINSERYYKWKKQHVSVIHRFLLQISRTYKKQP